MHTAGTLTDCNTLWRLKMKKIVVASRGRNPDDRNERKLRSNGRWVQMLDVCVGGGYGAIV